MYTVKETAKIMGMTEHSIRYYTDKGLVPTVQRDKNNIRQFDNESLNWLTGIKCLRACGLSIDAIKEYCDLCLEGDSTIDRRYEIILDAKKNAEIQLEEAKERVKYMEGKVKHYEDTINKHLPDVMNPLIWPSKDIV